MLKQSKSVEKMLSSSQSLLQCVNLLIRFTMITSTLEFQSITGFNLLAVICRKNSIVCQSGSIKTTNPAEKSALCRLCKRKQQRST